MPISRSLLQNKGPLRRFLLPVKQFLPPVRAVDVGPPAGPLAEIIRISNHRLSRQPFILIHLSVRLRILG